MGGGRAALRRSLEVGLHSLGVPGVARWWRRGRVLVLAYHNIVPEGAESAGERSLHLPQREFAKQLDLLLETHRVIPLSALFQPTAETERPSVVLTFDDAYHGAISAGVRELATRRLPATFFVVPSFVGGREFWWDALATPGVGTLPDGVRGRALEGWAGDDEAVRRWAREAGLTLHDLPGHARTATEAELKIAAAVPGISLDSHTWSHRALSLLPPGDREQELRRPLEWLRTHLGVTGAWCSCPYGDWSPQVAAAAAQAGYRGALRLDGGWVPREGLDLFSTPRLNIPAGMSARGFRLRVDGVMTR